MHSLYATAQRKTAIYCDSLFLTYKANSPIVGIQESGFFIFFARHGFAGFVADYEGLRKGTSII